ncbi:TM0106 family RecB-like putative nuclease [Acidipropionibacterium jensenii]|nr:TM0106 family RecB-like putative nuclease [Acidipropionibacterium jensenii]
MEGMTAAILLDAWAARSCPVKTQNAFDPTLDHSDPAAEANADLFAGSRDLVDLVCDRLATVPGTVDLRPLAEGDTAAHRLATDRALAAGAPVIIAPALPDSPAGHRTGSPEVLVRSGAQRSSAGCGYLPVIITPHRVLERHHTRAQFTWTTALADPDPAAATLSSDQTFRSARQGPLLQAAHYWRLLADLDLLPAPTRLPAARLAGIVGRDQVDQLSGEHGIAWLDLDHHFIRTFSRTAASGWRRRSVLDRYDHEHEFRVAVAHHAMSSPQHPMVEPIVVGECESCQWWSTCQPRLDDADLSLRISKAPLDVREIAALRRMGVSTVDDLADADLETLLPDYLPQVQHRPEAERRIRLAARRARLIRDGVCLERNDADPIRLPVSRLEIDLDIETSPTDKVYLWGFWVDDRDHLLAASRGHDGPYYLAFSSFEDLDDAAEAALAARAIDWLDEAVRAEPGCLIVHYSDYEKVHLRRFGRASSPCPDRTTGQVARLLASGCFLDLFAVMRAHFFGTAGLGLKVVAQAGPGFHWRDAEPGGLNSQIWWDQAAHHADPARRASARARVLAYNEDDVRATCALRGWLRAGAVVPGSAAVPSAPPGAVSGAVSAASH